jgi:hypothetical protein
MKRGKNKGKSGAIKTVEDLRRIGEARILNEKIEQSNNRHKLMAKLDPKTAEFTRREFARLGLF